MQDSMKQNQGPRKIRGSVTTMTRDSVSLASENTAAVDNERTTMTTRTALSSSSPSSTTETSQLVTPTAVTAPPLEYPRGHTVPFPYERPYPQQAALMDALLQGIRRSNSGTNSIQSTTTKLLCLESPTGTGKSLSLACASLAWLEYMTQRDDNNHNAIMSESTSTTSTPIATVTLLKAAASSPTSTSSSSPPPTTTAPITAATGRSWLDDWQPDDPDQEDQERKETKWQQLRSERQIALQVQLDQIRAQFLPEGTESTDAANAAQRREHLIRQAIAKTKLQARKAQRQRRRQRKVLAVSPKPSLAYEDENDGDNDNIDHDFEQAQHTKGSPEWLIEDLYDNRNNTSQPRRRPRKIIYAARTHTQLAQFISEVRKTKWGSTLRVVSLASRGQGLCGYLTKASESSLTDQCLELRKSKKRNNTAGSTCGCPYFQPSSIATLALHSLAAPSDVEDWAQWGKTTQTCSYYATRQALPHAQLVVVPYSILVDPKTRASVGLDLQDALVLVDEAHNLPSAIAHLTGCQLSHKVCNGALAQVQNYTTKYLDKLSPRHLQLLGQLKTLLKGFQKSLSKPRVALFPANKSTTITSSKKELLSITEYLCDYGLDLINLFPLLRYLQESKLSQKLMGFLDPTIDAGISKHISPMSIVETFLHKLNYQADDAKIVLSPSVANDDEDKLQGRLELVVLNPAVHAQDDLYQLPHALCLVGGTLQPLNVLVQELIPSLHHDARKAQEQIRLSSTQTTLYESPSFVGFSCGHVVSSDHVLLQAVTQIDGVSLDLRHKTRSSPERIEALGNALLKLARRIPHGLVVFVPSYSYEKTLVKAWQKSGVWKQMAAIKPLFREPTQSNQMEATLSAYSKAATSSVQGAMLLSVIGGKLSEGINFADDLCRCVVVIGLPYADRSDPVLQERLRLVDQPNDYYQSLCLRAVNQSVGRAIRHAQDYASVILMDQRYPSSEGIARGLPQWLTQSTPSWRRQNGTMGTCLNNLQAFFEKQDQKI